VQKDNHLFVASGMLECAETDENFVENIIGETYVHAYDPKAKHQNSSDRVLIVLFSYKGVMHHEYAQ
jgi:hypothetical protein